MNYTCHITFLAPLILQKNIVIERNNMTLLNTTRMMLIDSIIPKYLWVEGNNIR